MDKSFIELLKSVGNQIDHTELNAAIKADNFEGEFALSDDGLASAKTQVANLFSLESAVNNPVIIERINKESYPKHMKSALSKVEDKLKPLYEKLGIDTTGAEYLSDLIGDIESKITESASTGGNKEVIEALNKELREAKESLDLKDEEFNTKIQERDASYLADKLKGVFMLEANKRTWADIYSEPGLKELILEKQWNSINAKAHLTLSPSGEIIPMQKDFPDKELYNGNKLETFQSLLEPEQENYLKKSDTKKPVKTESKAQVNNDDLTPGQRSILANRDKFKMVS